MRRKLQGSVASFAATIALLSLTLSPAQAGAGGTADPVGDTIYAADITSFSYANNKSAVVLRLTGLNPESLTAVNPSSWSPSYRAVFSMRKGKQTVYRYYLDGGPLEERPPYLQPWQTWSPCGITASGSDRVILKIPRKCLKGVADDLRFRVRTEYVGVLVNPGLPSSPSDSFDTVRWSPVISRAR